VSVIPETVVSAEVAKSRLDTILGEQKKQRALEDSLRKQLEDLRTPRELIDQEIGKAKREYRYAVHIESGKCANLLSKGDTWNHYDEPCPNKRKPDSRFCGVHQKFYDKRAKP
jgi:hypothetical protein